MKLRKTVLRLLLLFPLITGIPAGCEEPCGPFELSELRITGFGTTLYSTSNRFLGHEIRGRFVYEQASMIGKPRTSFGQSAYACSPPPLTYTTDISKITIISNSDYSADYPTGSDLLELFDILQYESKEFPLEIYSPNIDFRLNTPPNEARNHSFTVQIDLDDGRTLTGSTPIILINP